MISMWNPYHSSSSVGQQQSQSFEASHSPLLNSSSTSDASNTSDKSVANLNQLSTNTNNNFIAAQTNFTNEEENQSNFQLGSFQNNHQSNSLVDSSSSVSSNSSENENSLIEATSSPLSTAQFHQAHSHFASHSLLYPNHNYNNNHFIPQPHSTYNYFNFDNSYPNYNSANLATHLSPAAATTIKQEEQRFDFSNNKPTAENNEENNLKLATPSLTSSPMQPLSNIVNTNNPSLFNSYTPSYYNNLSLNPTFNPYSHYNNSYNNPNNTSAQYNYTTQPYIRENLFANSTNSNSSLLEKPIVEHPQQQQQQPQQQPMKQSSFNNQQTLSQSNNYSLNYDQSTSPSFGHQVLNTANLTSTNSKNNPNIKVKLQDMSLWKQFNQIGTEMIITKTGRRMFPSLRVSVSGLEASVKYLMVVDVIPVDDNRYKYHNCEWIVSGKGEAHFAGRGYLHPDSPLSGNQWTKQIVSFHKLKLTNNPFDRSGHIILNSMHKYVPRLHVIEEGKSINTFVFAEAVFTAVTAYQNEAITKLKIEYNPFAKGFRDGQNRKDYRAKRGSDDENETNDERPYINQSQFNPAIQQQQQHMNFNAQNNSKISRIR